MPAAVEDWLARRTGLRLGPEARAKAGALLRARAGRRFPTLAAYCASLSDAELAAELESLAARLTPGETFFFRDHGQFDLMRFQLLPELVELRRGQRSLRLWSAGCASGEEAYSLAMLVDMALPERRSWHVSIIGTDINQEALAKARRARYGRWSFRMAPASLQDRYFRRQGDEWELDEDIRRMLVFRTGSLVADPLPDGPFRDMDLILCRNVFIYFSPEAVREVAAKLTACLAAGGYLVAGHTELIGFPLPELRSRLFPEGVVYQREASPRLPQPPLPAAPVQSSPAPPRQPAPDAPDAPAPGASAAAAAGLAAAQALADRGDYDAAESACSRAAAADPLVPGPHFLLAQLAQLRGDYGEAEVQLNRTLYLAPGHVAAYLELAALCERAGQTERALARRRTALDLLRRLPPDARVDPFEASAGQLAAWLVQTEAL